MNGRRAVSMLACLFVVGLVLGFGPLRPNQGNGIETDTDQSELTDSTKTQFDALAYQMLLAAGPVRTNTATAAPATTPRTLEIKILRKASWWWKKLRGNPAGISLKEQIAHFPLPADVKAAMLLQVTTLQPDSVWVQGRGETFNGVAFGGRTNNVFTVVVGNIHLDLHDKDTGARVDSTRAIRYPAITGNNGTTYQLYQVIACTNGAWKEVPPTKVGQPLPPANPPDAERTPEPTPKSEPASPASRSTATPTPTPTPAPTPGIMTEIPFDDPGPASWVVKGTVWVTGEGVNGKNGPSGNGNHTNGFVGTELTIRKSFGSPYIGVFRLAGGAIEERAGGALIRAGLRRSVFRTLYWGGHLEAGGFYQMDQAIWREEQWISQTRLHWQERRTTVSDVGAYLRTGGFGSHQSSWDVRAATGHHLQREVEAEASASPGRYFLHAAARESKYDERAFEHDDREVHLPSTRFTAREGVVGFRPRANHRISVGWKSWKSQTPTWKGDSDGPTLQYLWEYKYGLRLRADATFFTNAHAQDLISGLTYDNDHERYVLGLNRNF